MKILQHWKADTHFFTVPAHVVGNEPLTISEFCSQAIITVGVGSTLIVEDLSVSSEQTVSLHLGRNATVLYKKQVSAKQVTQKKQTICVMADAQARCVLLITGTHAGTFEGYYSAASLASGAEFFLGIATRVQVGANCTYTIMQKHAYPAVRSASRIYSVVEAQALLHVQGLISMTKQAQLSDAEHKVHGITHGQGARAFAEPQLIIEPHQVRCVHGAAVGPLDDHARFYLASRGITENEAITVLQGAFLAQIYEYVPEWAADQQK